jgi:hypothetical protein
VAWVRAGGYIVARGVVLASLHVIEGDRPVIAGARAAGDDGPASKVGESVQEDANTRAQLTRSHVGLSKRPELGIGHRGADLVVALHQASAPGSLVIGAEANVAALRDEGVATAVVVDHLPPESAVTEQIGLTIEPENVGAAGTVALTVLPEDLRSLSDVAG